MKRLRFAAFSCPHCPFENERAIDQLIRVVRSHKPHVLVCLGDLFEMDAASRWEDESQHDLAQEYEHGAALLRRVRSAAPAAQPVWMLGNHDDNLCQPGRVKPNIRGLLHWSRHDDAGEFERWRQVAYRKDVHGVYTLGPVAFLHGFDAGRASDRSEAVQVSNLLGGWPNLLVVRGHTHRPKEPTRVLLTPSIPLPVWYANAGTVGPLKPDYMMRKDTSEWAPAVVVGEAQTTGNIWKGRTWEATTVML